MRRERQGQAALWCLALATRMSATAQPVTITVQDEVLATIGAEFSGVHYDGPTHRARDDVRRKVVDMPSAFASRHCRERLRSAGVRVARIFVNVPKVHPRPDAFDWGTTDTQVAEVIESGMVAMLCLHQRAATWFVGDKERPWWQVNAGRKAWREFARVCAQRYRGKARYYEVLNEPNHLHRDKANYVGWGMSVALFMDAAKEIKAVDPQALVGGAATWAAWESATWGRRVLAQPDGERLLDFVSYHIYTSHSLGDSDEQIVAKTPWFEEAPVYVRRELAALTQKRILLALTEYNASAVTSKDGKPFTDPRNVSTFGGVLAALAMLHSARGGCDMVVHFGTTGGFGLIRWPPEYQVRRPYHAVRMLHDAAGLRPGAQVLKTQTNEPAKEAGSCVRGKWYARDLEAFALRHDGAVAVALVNKRGKEAVRAAIVLPGSREATLYQYSSTRLHDARYPLATLKSASGRFDIECPAYSVTVLRTRQRLHEN